MFSTIEGGLIRPRNLSKAWARARSAMKLPAVSFHAFRHSHASMLIRAGVDILTISWRLGHVQASITLDRYGHLIEGADKTAADAIRGGVKMTEEAGREFTALLDQLVAWILRDTPGRSDQASISRRDKQEAIEALIELEAVAMADKLGLPLEMARNKVRELLEKGELEVRPIGDGRFILCDRDGTAKWLHFVK